VSNTKEKHMRKFRGRALLGAALAVALVAGACGRDDGGSSNGGNGGGDAQVQAGPGFDGTTITLGVLTPTSGTAALLGSPLTAGNQAFVDRINAEGGIAGKYKLKLEVRDTEYKADVALTQYNDTKRDVAMYLQVLGTAITDAILPQMETDGLLAGPATLDAEWVGNPNLMPIGGPYQVQAINAFQYAKDNLDADNATVCTITKDDSYGKAGLDGAEYAAEQLDVTIASSQTFRQGDTVFTSQINSLRDAGCEIVWLTALPTESIPMLTEASGLGFAPTWLANSPAWINQLGGGPLGSYLAENFLLMSEGPQWGDTSVPGMAQMLEDIAKYAPGQGANIYFAFGYAQAWAAAQILEKAVENGDLSPAGIVAAAEEVDTLTFGGLVGDYTYGKAADRNPPRGTSVFKVNPAVDGFLELVETVTSRSAEDYTFED
jgi:ABC-type branched-subunit amino acid transport system substrate-binding protein